MEYKDLKHKPLVEAILEIKWKVTKGGAPTPINPPYRLFIGRFYDRVSAKYPAYETLEAAAVPEEMASQIVQYRFRAKENGWPLIQIGPGILTFNETDAYTWKIFENNASWALNKLLESYPSKLDFEVLNLRYIDAVEVDYSKESALAFLHDKLKIGVGFPQSLFEGGQVDVSPTAFVLQSSFGCKMPKGTLQIKFGRGKKNEKEALIWETVISSSGSDVPPVPDQFAKWLSQAHEITDDWFFKLIEGELLAAFE